VEEEWDAGLWMQSRRLRERMDNVDEDGFKNEEKT